MLNRVLRPLSLEVEDWLGTTYVLRAPGGGSVLCSDLATLFAEAERLCGRKLDPLDGELLAGWGAA